MVSGQLCFHGMGIHQEWSCTCSSVYMSIFMHPHCRRNRIATMVTKIKIGITSFKKSRMELCLFYMKNKQTYTFDFCSAMCTWTLVSQCVGVAGIILVFSVFYGGILEFF